MATIRKKTQDGTYPKLTMQQFITLANILIVRDASRLESCKVLVFDEKLTHVAKQSLRTARSIRYSLEMFTKAHWWILSGYDFTDPSNGLTANRLNVLFRLLNVKTERCLPIMSVLLHGQTIRQSAEQYNMSASFLSTLIKRLKETNTEVMQSYDPRQNTVAKAQKGYYAQITTPKKINACALGM